MRIFGFDITRKSNEEQKISQTPTLTDRKGLSVKRMSDYLELFTPANSYRNYSFLFHNISEVQFPIMYVARRIAGAQFVLRKSVDDTILWADTARGIKDKYVAGIIEKGLMESPNPYMTFKEFVLNSFINKFLFGNMYIYAYTEKNTGRLWETCSEFYALQPDSVTIENRWNQYIGGDKDVVYRYSNGGQLITIPQDLMYHLIDLPSFKSTQEGARKGRSRLDALKYPLSNIIAVYEARNAIYVKRGALGLVVNQTHDADGSVALTPNEKDKMLKDFEQTYGVGYDKSPVAIMSKPVSYIPIGMSIAALQPFEECLLDAAAIAGAYGVDSNLIPRKDKPTYSNLNTAELNVYNAVAIPELQAWLDGFNKFLGLYDAGYYIDAVWDKVSVLQENEQRRETSKRAISDRCKSEFDAGLITMNDWRAATGRERIAEEIYDKTLLEMTEEEITNIKKRIS